MIIQYPRISSLAIFSVTLVLGLLALSWFSPKIGAIQAAGDISPQATLEQLELSIASDNASALTWFYYGERLREARRFSHAAQAYRKVLEMEPYHRDARFHCALSLAQAGGEDFYLFMRDLIFSHAKMAVDIFERREVQPYLAQARFQELRRDAQNLAMD